MVDEGASGMLLVVFIGASNFVKRAYFWNSTQERGEAVRKNSIGNGLNVLTMRFGLESKSMCHQEKASIVLQGTRGKHKLLPAYYYGKCALSLLLRALWSLCTKNTFPT